MLEELSSGSEGEADGDGAVKKWTSECEGRLRHETDGRECLLWKIGKHLFFELWREGREVHGRGSKERGEGRRIERAGRDETRSVELIKLHIDWDD